MYRDEIAFSMQSVLGESQKITSHPLEKPLKSVRLLWPDSQSEGVYVTGFEVNHGGHVYGFAVGPFAASEFSSKKEASHVFSVRLFPGDTLSILVKYAGPPKSVQPAIIGEVLNAP